MVRMIWLFAAMASLASTATRAGGEWIGIKDLADELGIPVRTVYNWRAQGKGPRGHMIGRHVRFRRRDVESWLDSLADEEVPAR